MSPSFWLLFVLLLETIGLMFLPSIRLVFGVPDSPFHR